MSSPSDPTIKPQDDGNARGGPTGSNNNLPNDPPISATPGTTAATNSSLDGHDATTKPPEGTESEPTTIVVKGYRLIREIGAGGQAFVFEAIQESTGRRVAVKLLRNAGLVSPAERMRFDREVQILASLAHPQIVQVLDRGRTDAGGDYLVMDYIAGLPLDRWLDEYYRKHPDGPPPEDPSELLRLFLRICDAVNAAHLRGVVHRDLKPSNLRIDADGVPHILDFGLAHLGMAGSGSGDSGSQPVTITGQFLGSLPWASPEQAEGDPHRIDVRTDVYALGVMLYQMLTGKFPYEVAGTMRDVLNNIVTSQPAPPSQMLSAKEAKEKKVRRKRRGGPQPLNPIIDAIVLKALAKRREERYQSAGDLARDIASYLAGKPTVAGGEMMAAQRGGGTRWLVAAAVVVIVGLCIGGPAWWMTRRPVGAGPAVTGPTDAKTQAAEVAPSLPSIDDHLPPMSPMALVSRPAKLPGLASWTLDTRAPRGDVMALTYSPDGRVLAVGTSDGTVRLLDAQTYELRQAYAVLDSPVVCLAYSPDGRCLAAASFHEVVFIDVEAGKMLRKIPDPPGGLGLSRLVWMPNGSAIAAIHGSMPVVLDRETGRWGSSLAPYQVYGRALAISPAGEVCATGRDGGVVFVDPVDGHVVRRFDPPVPGDVPVDVAWSPDGKMLAGAFQSAGKVICWDEHGRVLNKIESLALPWQVCWSPKGRMLAIAGETHVSLYEPGESPVELKQGGRSADHLAAWSPDEKTIATVGNEASSVEIWNLAGQNHRKTVPGWLSLRRNIDPASLNPTTQEIMVAGWESAGLWSLPSGRMIGEMTGDVEQFSSPVGSSADHALAALSSSGVMGVLLVSKEPFGFNAGQEKKPMPHDLAFAHQGGRLAVVFPSVGVDIFDPLKSNERRSVPINSQPLVTVVAWSPDDRFIAVAADRVLLIDVELSKVVAESKPIHVNDQIQARCLAWSAKGDRLALGLELDGSANGQTVILDGKSLSELGRTRVLPGNVLGVAWAADGQTIFAAHDKNGVYTFASTGGSPGEKNLDGAAGRLFGNGRWMVAQCMFGDVHSGLPFARLYDVSAGLDICTVLPLKPGAGLFVMPDGRHHLEGASEKDLTYLAVTDAGEHLTLTPDQFTTRYGWKNDPTKVGVNLDPLHP